MSRKKLSTTKRQEKLTRDRKEYRQLYIEGVPKTEHPRTSFHEFRETKRPLITPRHHEVITFWASRSHHINYQHKPSLLLGQLVVPTVFSLTDPIYTADSFAFIYKLFDVLYYQRVSEVHINYLNCIRIDVDASVCMDVLLHQFVKYINSCRTSEQQIKVKVINFNKESISKVLFSIGSFSLIRDLNLSYHDVVPLRLQVGCRQDDRNFESLGREVTKICDYVEKCLGQMGRELSNQSYKNLCDSVGEVLNNADEHATTNYRYSIGYFQKCEPDEDVLGILQLVIMNFGDTIYEKFKDPACPNLEVVQQMKALSDTYTKKGWLNKASFEEETLWTLYAIQQGVTSTKAKRGNGFICLIERFFNLKGDMEHDNMSQMTIVSGHTHIVFDGTHQIKTANRVSATGRSSEVKLMTFNTVNNFLEQPDKNFVKFVPEYFPGTLISARICIKPGNTAIINNRQTNK